MHIANLVDVELTDLVRFEELTKMKLNRNDILLIQKDIVRKGITKDIAYFH